MRPFSIGGYDNNAWLLAVKIEYIMTLQVINYY